MCLQQAMDQWKMDLLKHVTLRLLEPGPVFTTLFRIRIKIRLKLNIILLWTFLKPIVI